MTGSEINTKIIHTPDLVVFEKVLEEADNKTLVIFDIDEVIITPQDQVLQTNYRHHLDILIEGLNENFNPKEVKELITLIHKARKKVIIDETILKIFDYLLSRKIMTLGLTHWPTGEMLGGGKFEHLRTLQLERVNIDFHAISPYSGELLISDMQSEHGSPLLHKGIVLTGLIEKGLVLEQILSKINIKPEKIIFIDDLIENIISVQSACARLAIEFIGFEYTAVKDLPLNVFNEKRARLQFDVLVKEKIWLSDSEADSRLIEIS